MISEILSIVSLISGIFMLVSTGGFAYILLSATKYSSRQNANKFFGSYMLNNPFRYTLAFAFLTIAAIVLSSGLIVSFITLILFDSTSVWGIAGTIALANLAVFFIVFTSMDNPKQLLNYVRFLKKNSQSSVR
jgi:hypothetical protein